SLPLCHSERSEKSIGGLYFRCPAHRLSNWILRCAENDEQKLIMSFKALNLSDSVLRGVQAAGYTDPTPIQLRAIPVVLGGGDLIASAQTGTGKTAAFALPILTRLGQHGRTRVLILEPTRELAAQVETAFRDFARFTDIRPVAIFGGVGYGNQRAE